MTADVPQGALSIVRLCVVAGVSRAGYYRHWQASAPRREETAVRDAIHRIALAHKTQRGYRYVTRELGRQGIPVNHKRVLRLMRQDNLLCLRKRSFVPVTTDSKHGWRVVPNLARNLEVCGLDQLWVADITYVHMQEEFAFLAVILDAFSRRVIGWAMEVHLQASLAVAALAMALEARKPAPGTLIHHSDRGVQYACAQYTQVLDAHGILASMSRVGNPYDNAKAESFFKTLKYEEVHASNYRDIDHARRSIATFLEEVYNRQRLHSALDYRPPAEFEALHRARLDASARSTDVGFAGMKKSTVTNKADRNAP